MYINVFPSTLRLYKMGFFKSVHRWGKAFLLRTPFLKLLHIHYLKLETLYIQLEIFPSTYDLKKLFKVIL